MRDTNDINGLDRCQLRLSNTFRELWVEHVLWTRLLF